MSRDAGQDVIDVAINIFAKPFQTALALLSLLRASGQHVGTLYLQFEPVGSQYDQISPYLIVEYLRATLGEERCCTFQPTHWIDLKSAEEERFSDTAYRHGIRYQYAFEHSAASLLFIMHNDIFVQRDIVGALAQARGDAIVVGQLGQCWNCPASNALVMERVCGLPPCSPLRYKEFRPDRETLHALYREARAAGIFVRPYDEAFESLFDARPWPLPECRVNEWACLLDLKTTRPLTVPYGDVWPFGGFRQCGTICLDTGVEWFRTLHQRGFYAQHYAVGSSVTHWVGTGKVTFQRYAKAEVNALQLLKRHFPQYFSWLCTRTKRTEYELFPAMPA